MKKNTKIIIANNNKEKHRKKLTVNLILCLLASQARHLFYRF